MRWFVVFLLLFSTQLFAESLQVQSVSQVGKWEPNKIQEVKVQLTLPKGFHAYTDQFKILNVIPADFKSGSIQVKPEVTFYDKFSKKNRTGLDGNGTVSFLLEASDTVDKNLNQVQFSFRYQICSEKVCFLPETISLNALTSGQPLPEIKKTAAAEFNLFKNIDHLLSSNLLFAFLIVFLAGVLTSFTPCIFPMLPITISILGYHANKGNRWHNFARACSYVLGIALTYASLGVVAALTGSLFGSALTNKYVLFFMCLLFIVMALSMWGLFDLQVPAFIRNRFGTGKSHGLGGAFVMGLAAGIVASPCVGPVLVSILSFVSTTKNVVLGFSLLFTFALGLGLIFIAIGLFSHALHLLPKSGPWMNFVKFLLGAGMWGAALYYSQFLVSQRWWTLLLALSLLLLSIWKGAFQFHKKNYLKQSFMLSLFVFSTTLVLLVFVRPQYLSPAFDVQDNPSSPKNEKALVWLTYSDAILESAKQEGKPVLLDFYADWCGACHELEEKTYTDPEFIELSKQFKLVKFDATEDNPENKQILNKYGVQGLPTVLFINRNGQIIKELTLTQFLPWKDFKPIMTEAAQ